jgi:hypothetical protein
MMVHGRKKCNEYICQDQGKAGNTLKKKLQITEHMILEFNQICIDYLSPSSGLPYFSTHDS